MAKWSEIWKDGRMNRSERALAVKIAACIPPAPAKAKTGGKYPHLQQAK